LSRATPFVIPKTSTRPKIWARSFGRTLRPGAKAAAGSRDVEGQVIFVALVRLRDNESFEQAFRRFKKSCEKSGILSEVKKREHYEKPSVRLKKKSLSARKRLIKKMKKQHHD
jgi:small subunit ribosomal protein S21